MLCGFVKSLLSRVVEICVLLPYMDGYYEHRKNFPDMDSPLDSNIKVWFLMQRVLKQAFRVYIMVFWFPLCIR